MAINNYNTIYAATIEELDNILDSLEHLKDNKDIVPIRDAAIKEFWSLKTDLQKSIESLNLNSEWNKFTIAFYGETNAGKSTLIETLRILLNESTKAREREAFSDAEKKYQNILLEISKTAASIDAISKEAQETKIKLLKEQEEIRHRIDSNEDEWVAQQCRIWLLTDRLYKNTINDWLYHLKSVFGKTDEHTEISSLKKQLNLTVKENEELHGLLYSTEEQIKNNDIDANNRITEYQNEIERLENDKDALFNNLIQFSDGQTISAQTDFTKKIISYDLHIKGTKLSLLDLPGIEGSEQLVQDEIQKAVEKAHVIFYVSAKSRAPQKGSDSNAGTIEKIEKQLSGQTEVYFVFNKGIANPRSLKPELTNDDDDLALSDVDNKFMEIFDKKYKGHFALSAYPPFVAVGNFVNETFVKARDKFLKFYTKEQIVQYSKIDAFCNWIINDISQNYESKIVTSNVNKIIHVLNVAISATKNTSDNLKEVKTKIIDDNGVVKQNIINSQTVLLNDIDNSIKIKIRKYITASRKEIYEAIDNGVSNKELAEATKDILKKNGSIIDHQNLLDSQLKQFNEEVSNALEGHKKYISDLFGIYADNYKLAYNTSVNIKTSSNIDIFAILVSIGGIVATIFAKMNPLLMVLSLIPGIISVGKEFYGIFDPNFKMDQQRKSVNKNLEKISKELKENADNIKISIGEETHNSFVKIFENLDEIEVRIDEALSVHDKCFFNLNDIAHNLKGDQNERT